MPATKDKNRNTWTVKFRYEDWQGNVKEVHKRGFPTKREALDWERQFKLNKANDVDMTFAEFIKRYKTDRLPQVKYSTEVNKTNIIDKALLRM